MEAQLLLDFFFLVWLVLFNVIFVGANSYIYSSISDHFESFLPVFFAVELDQQSSPYFRVTPRVLLLSSIHGDYSCSLKFNFLI